MTDNNRLRSRAIKLLALAQRGIGGEKENAARMLEKLLAKHGMTLADLDPSNEARTELQLTYSTQEERKLIVQIAAMILNTRGPSLYRHHRRKALTIEVTPAQRADIILHYETYRIALRGHMQRAKKIAMSAFIHANNIFPTANDEETTSAPDIPPEELAELLAAIRNIRPTQVRKLIAP